MKKILITGATGLIGSTLLDLLSKEDYELICLVRDPNKLDNRRLNVRLVVGDISDSNIIDNFKDLNIDTIYHLASLNPLYKDMKMQRRVNINGMENLLKIAEKVNAKHIIYAQGMGIFKEGYISEDSERVADTEFTRIRYEAERLLLSKSNRFKVCIPILGDVYGPKGWFLDVINRLLKNRFRIPGDGEYYRSFVHVYDVANALKLLGEYEKEGYYIVCDDQPTKFKDFVYYLADRLKLKRPGNIPSFIAKLIVGSNLVELMMRSYIATNLKLKSELNLKLRFPTYREGVDDILASLPIYYGRGIKS